MKIEKVKNGAAVSREMLLLGDIEGGNGFGDVTSLLDYGGPEKLHSFKWGWVARCHLISSLSTHAAKNRKETTHYQTELGRGFWLRLEKVSACR